MHGDSAGNAKTQRRSGLRAAVPILFAGLLAAGCNRPEPPAGFSISVASDSSVALTWSAAPRTRPDKFVLRFRDVAQETAAVLAETSGQTYLHNPSGRTGVYSLAAVFGNTEYPALESCSTIPVHSGPDMVAELNGPGNAGYGWERSGGAAYLSSMFDSTAAARADVYVSDFAAGHGQLPWYVASPGVAGLDPGGPVAGAGWRPTRLTNPLDSEQMPPPAQSSRAYFEWTELQADTTILACFTTDSHYALVKVWGVDTTAGTLQLEAWYQSMPGLRLTAHRSR